MISNSSNSRRVAPEKIPPLAANTYRGRTPSLTEIRCTVGISQVEAAVIAETSIGTIRLYEARPDAICAPELRKRLDQLYSKLKIELMRGPRS